MFIDFKDKDIAGPFPENQSEYRDILVKMILDIIYNRYTVLWKDLNDDEHNVKVKQALGLTSALSDIDCYIDYNPDKDHPYVPPGLDVTKVDLKAVEYFSDAEVETLACLMHEVWVEEKIKAGWVHGDIKNTVDRIHPDVLPWNELSPYKQSKDIDICTVLPTVLKDINAVIYRIVPKDATGKERIYFDRLRIPLIMAVSGCDYLGNRGEIEYQKNIDHVNKAFSSLLAKLESLGFKNKDMILLTDFSNDAEEEIARTASNRGIFLAPVIPRRYYENEHYSKFKDKQNGTVLSECVLNDYRVNTTESYREVSAYLVSNAHILISVWDLQVTFEKGGAYDTIRMAVNGVDTDLLSCMAPKSCIDVRPEISPHHFVTNPDCLIYLIRVNRPPMDFILESAIDRTYGNHSGAAFTAHCPAYINGEPWNTAIYMDDDIPGWFLERELKEDNEKKGPLAKVLSAVRNACSAAKKKIRGSGPEPCKGHIIIDGTRMKMAGEIPDSYRSVLARIVEINEDVARWYEDNYKRGKEDSLEFPINLGTVVKLMGWIRDQLAKNLGIKTKSKAPKETYYEKTESILANYDPERFRKDGYGLLDGSKERDSSIIAFQYGSSNNSFIIDADKPTGEQRDSPAADEYAVHELCDDTRFQMDRLGIGGLSGESLYRLKRSDVMADMAGRYSIFKALSKKYSNHDKYDIRLITLMTVLYTVFFNFVLLFSNSMLLIAAYTIAYILANLFIITNDSSREHEKAAIYKLLAECTKVEFYWGILGINDTTSVRNVNLKRNGLSWLNCVMKGCNSFFTNDYIGSKTKNSGIDTITRTEVVRDNWLASQKIRDKEQSDKELSSNRKWSKANAIMVLNASILSILGMALVFLFTDVMNAELSSFISYFGTKITITRYVLIKIIILVLLNVSTIILLKLGGLRFTSRDQAEAARMLIDDALFELSNSEHLSMRFIIYRKLSIFWELGNNLVQETSESVSASLKKKNKISSLSFSKAGAKSAAKAENNAEMEMAK